MRFKNAAGNWGNNRIYLFNNNASGSDITKYEYWFDNDYANKVVEPVQPGQSVNFSTLIDCSNLSQGFHFFNIRVKDQQHWSNSMIKYLFVGPVVEGQQFISGFEYWIDQDISQRIYVPITPDSLVQINDILDFAAISDGFHNLFLRVRNEAGQWSNVVHKHFYKYYNQSSQNNIIGYEYWFDSDYDNKTSVNILHIPTYSISTFVDCEHVDDGLHLFNVRFKNAAGSWSNSRIGFFYKNQEEAQNRILAYRYWIDDDYANSTLVNLTTQANPFYANMELLISPQSAGNHTFYIQYKDLNGWGNVVSQEFIYQANQLIGEVYDSYTGFPIVEALVQVQPQIDYGSGISDSNGEFVVIPVPTGIGYEIVVGANGYISKNIPSIDFYGGPNSDTVFVFLDPSIGAYSVVPLVPNPNSAISEIIEGGIGHRYYRVADNQDNSIANAEVSVNKQSGGTLSFHTDISGILDMEIGSTNVGSGSSSASELFEIVSVNAIPLQDTITFSCSIINKEYSKSWRNYTYTRGSISFVDVDNKRGAEVTVTGNGQSNNPPDELYLARQGRAYVGVTFGVSASAEIGMGEVVNHRFSQVLKLCIICS
ncbi:MAG: carboxypeptidase-like regulatory domain-containing protein [Bacteroidales bacterium]|nr:carboxypeptidase-like regulatory domain-containing protein [Bacteroidales bacterium]